MKNLVFFSITSILIVSFILLSKKTEENTQVVITISNLTFEDLSNLNKEFKRHPYIAYVDGSIESSTIAINIDDENFNQDKIENMLSKWDCTATNFDYINLLDIAIIE